MIQEAEIFQTVASETPSSVMHRNLQEIREELDFDCVKFAVVIMQFGGVTNSRLWILQQDEKPQEP